MQDIRSMLIHDEQIRLTVYDDKTGEPIGPGSVVVGHPTIAIGVCVDKYGGITTEEAFYLFDNRLRNSRAAGETFPWFKTLDSVRKDVVVMMIFQLGLQGFCEFRKAIQAIASGRFEYASSEMLNSHWAAQAKERAVRLADMMRTGAYPEKLS